MPTLLGHAAAGAALGVLSAGGRWHARRVVVAVACAVLPDLDVVGLRMGIPYGSTWGHRGLSHALLTATLLGLLAMVVCFRKHEWRPGLALGLVMAAASHGVLDAMTSGGLGVGFFEPFVGDRYFLPWRPIRVSPLAPSRILSPRFWAVLASEVQWIVGPVFLLLSGLGLGRWMVGRRRARET